MKEELTPAQEDALDKLKRHGRGNWITARQANTKRHLLMDLVVRGLARYRLYETDGIQFREIVV